MYDSSVYKHDLLYLKSLSLYKSAFYLKKDSFLYIKAMESFLELLENFPNTVFLNQIYNNILTIRSILSKNELDIAQYYINRKLYISAINRLRLIVYEYNDTDAHKVAIAKLKKIYTILGFSGNDFMSLLYYQDKNVN